MVTKSKQQGESPFDQPEPELRNKGTVDPVAARMSQASAPEVTIPETPESSTCTAVVGSFADRTHAQEAVNELRQAGFSEEEIGLVAKDDSLSDVVPVVDDEAEGMTEGAVAGSLTGAGIAGLWAIGISAGILPAVGPAIAGGILASVLTSALAGAAVGGIVGSLVGLGLSEEEARHYDRAFHAGHTIVTVRSDRPTEAAQILARHGAVTNVSSQSLSDTGEPAVPMIGM